MKKKILKIMIIISSLLLILFGIITLQMLGRVRDILIDNSTKTGDKVEEYSDVAMRDQITERLSATALGCAYVVNETLQNFAGSVQIIADSATDIYSNPENYGAAVVRIPDKADIGRSMGQLVYAPDVNPEDENLQKEISLLGNLQGSMLAMYKQYPDLGAVSIGTETGTLLLAGPVLADRWEADGSYSYLDARTRPWYTDAKAAGEARFAKITADYDTGRLAIMCGAPVYRGEKFVGVAGAGLYLEGIEPIVMNARLSDEGSSCIIDNDGKIIFSSQDSGDLKTQTILGEAEDGNSEMAALVSKAIQGESGLELLDVNGISSYVAYSPIEVVGWSLISIIPEKLVLKPKEELITALNDSRKSELYEVSNVIGSALIKILIMIAVIGIVVAVFSSVLSRWLVAPVELLTKKVQRVDGDQLEFDWSINTNDEVQELATTFGHMTERMKKYINDIQTVTAEKERMGVELGLAKKIQASMLPHDFPPFPDRKEVDIYALMEPAREVGGDFYDFFFIDNDHLCFVIADVSGKGIPAALFMMVSKIIIKSCAMLGQSTADIFTKTNEALSKDNQTGMFVTSWLGILEVSTGVITCVNAGHEYPALKRADGDFELIKDKHGFVIGGMEGIKYKEYSLTLNPGDKMFLYTDGVPEATNKKDKMYGTTRMVEALNKNANGTVEDILATVRSDISDFVQDAEQFDDLTMMCFKIN